jgi:hypothetical protein
MLYRVILPRLVTYAVKRYVIFMVLGGITGAM